MGGSCSCLSRRSKLAILASSTPLSIHGHIVVESLASPNSSQTIEERIEHSKNQWSQLSQFALDAEEVVEVSNVKVFQTLQAHPKLGTFFKTFGKDGLGELVMGQKFAEGGQAELYDVEIKWNNPQILEEDMAHRQTWILKVFKKGTSLRQLQSQWPRGMLQECVDRIEWERLGNVSQIRVVSDVFYGILLEDGRFAFLMVKEDEDLRHQIDRLMLTTSKNCCPYLKKDVEATMCEVAEGVEWLHSHSIVHRDLKAANVLCSRFERGSGCCVADFECSIGVIGTGFFRAPEILQACKDYSINAKPELFTKEVDAYSYGMVCYEILTGKLPFEDYSLHDYDHVLRGERPKLPEYVDGWIRDLLRMCWQANPMDRSSFGPSFGVISEILLANSQECRKIQARRQKQEEMGRNDLVVMIGASRK